MQANVAALDKKLETVANELGATPHAVALAWLLKHPADIVPIMSTSSTEHLAQNAKAAEITRTDEVWYELLLESVRAIEL